MCKVEKKLFASDLELTLPIKFTSFNGLLLFLLLAVVPTSLPFFGQWIRLIFFLEINKIYYYLLSVRK